jgi:hypothetical protein
MIGLGLTALGVGVRYQHANVDLKNPATDHVWGGTSLTLILVVLLISLGIGVAVAFMGLMFHHERRYRERLHHEAAGGVGTRMPV